ncbi:MAG TPA: recombinase family protein [Solirubrobacterales bacterium]|nr:recombinase family protein [Solirubrobacterales bacterium]
MEVGDLRLDGYIRVSRVGGREGEGYISPDVQRDAITGYASELGGSIVAWHDDQDYSGGNTQRPGFRAMLDRLEAGLTDGIIVMSVDRFARSTGDGSTIIREIVDRGQVFASCHERIDPRTDEGRYMLRSFLNNAELFLDQAKTRWNTAKARAVARGAHIGPTPIGYLKVDPVPTKPTHISPVDSAALGGPTGPGLLVPSPTHGPAMEKLFKRAATRQYGDSALAHWMTEEAPRHGGAPWNPSEVRRWLRNRVYLGEVRHAGLVNTEAHAPLTDERTWQRCQREAGEQRKAAAPFLLKGLIRCASCRYAMGGQAQGGRSGALPVYRCPRSNRGCPAPSVISAGPVEGYVASLVEERQKDLLIGQTAVDPEGNAAIEAFAAAELEVEKFAADVEARRLLGEQGWQEALRVRVENREDRRAARDLALSTQEARELLERSVNDLDRHGLRNLLTGMIHHIFIRRAPRGAPPADRVLVVWSDDPERIDVPGPHRAGPFEPIGW